MSNIIGGGGNGCYPVDKTPRQRVVIFDSPDGTGKTEMAWALSRELNIPYFRMHTQHENWRKGRFKDALELDQTLMAELIRQTRLDVVVDRAYPAEWVYSQVYDRETNMDALREIDKTYARLGAWIVIPLRHDYTGGKIDELVTREMLPKLHEKYLEFRKWTKCNTISIYVDAFGNSIQREIPALMRELSFEQRGGFSIDIVLDRSDEKKDIRDILRTSQLYSSESDFKGEF